MVRIKQNNNFIIIEYYPELIDPEVIKENLKKGEEIKIGQIFQLKQSNLFKYEDSGWFEFKLAVMNEDGFYKVDIEILGLKNNFFLDKDIKWKIEYFRSYRGISILGKIDQLIDESVYITKREIQIIEGGTIPIKDFELLIRNFPNSTETKHYVSSRISNILSTYLPTMSDAENVFRQYIKQYKENPLTSRKQKESKNIEDTINEFEFEKYTLIKQRIEEMLGKNHLEKDWQNMLEKFLLLIFPKYIHIFSETSLLDTTKKDTFRYLDFILIDANGYVDIIEIKRDDIKILSENKNYRGNYIPLSPLSGTVMQAEKYLNHLNRWGEKGEKKLREIYKNQLHGVEIKIRNPKSIIILGRSNNMSDEQKSDFEIIKRKYSNMTDIITYDDLLCRLKNIINKFSKNDSEQTN